LNRAEWNQLADDFEELVCDVALDETSDQLRRYVDAARPSKEKSVLVDLGCGIGSFIQKFGGRFREIVGVEFAARTIARAKERCAAIDGIEWHTMDVARAAKRIGQRADLTVCMNVITAPRKATRDAQWAGVATVTKPSGFALIVVPSIESEEMIQARIRRGASGIKSTQTADGLVEFDGSAQKYYRRDELMSVVRDNGFDVKRIGQLRAPWAREGMTNPRRPGIQNPWDWIVLARRQA